MESIEDIPEALSFSGTEGLTASEFIQMFQNVVFEGASPKRYSSEQVASLCFTGLALEWYERLAVDVQEDWGRLSSALLARFPPADTSSIIFTGDSPGGCRAFIDFVEQHRQAEGGREANDLWLARFAGQHLGGEALRWHIGLNGGEASRNRWSALKTKLIKKFPDPPAVDSLCPGRIPFRRLDEVIPAPSFLPRTREQWLEQAFQRREQYDRGDADSRSGIYWVLVMDRDARVPHKAIQTGRERHGAPLYTARAWMGDGLHPGKCGEHLPFGHFAYGGQEDNLVREYEVLVGNPACVRWIDVAFISPTYWDDSPVRMKAVDAVEGGVDADGTPLLLASTNFNEWGWQPAKVNLRRELCDFGYDGKAWKADSCRILVWANF